MDKKALTIGDRIRVVRRRLGLSQSDFAESVGISQNYLSQIEKDRSRPARPLLLAIEYRYKVGAEWLEYGKESGESASKVCEEMAQHSEDADLRKIIGDLNRLYGKGGEKLDIVKRLIEIFVKENKRRA